MKSVVTSSSGGRAASKDLSLQCAQQGFWRLVSCGSQKQWDTFSTGLCRWVFPKRMMFLALCFRQQLYFSLDKFVTSYGYSWKMKHFSLCPPLLYHVAYWTTGNLKIFVISSVVAFTNSLFRYDNERMFSCNMNNAVHITAVWDRISGMHFLYFILSYGIIVT